MSKSFDATFQDNAFEQQKPKCFGNIKNNSICSMCEFAATCAVCSVKTFPPEQDIVSCSDAKKQLGQPDPTPNNHRATWALVISDMALRHNVGMERYGTPLQPHNGRDSLQDAYEEALDLCCYLRNAIEERRIK